MDRAAARALGCKALPGGNRRANQDASSGLCRKGHYHQLQRPGSDCLRRSLAKDKRRETGQEGDARTLRPIILASRNEALEVPQAVQCEVATDWYRNKENRKDCMWYPSKYGADDI